MQRKSRLDWHRELTPEQYYVCWQKGTERPYTGRYWNHYDIGVYSCACCGTPLFHSMDKVDANNGWPNFAAAIDNQRVRHHDDFSHGMHRIEVSCNCCGAHLGHHFSDSQRPGGQFYRINSLALAFLATPATNEEG